MLPEILKEVYKSPKSTLLGVLAGVAGVLLVVVQGGTGGLDSLDPSELMTSGALLVGMIAGLLKKDKK